MTTATSAPSLTKVDPQPWSWTKGQYYRLGELGFFEGKRVELINGEIIATSPINCTFGRAEQYHRCCRNACLNAGKWPG